MYIRDMSIIRFTSILSLMGLIACGSGYKDLNINEFEETLSHGSTALVDVRTPEEYAEGHLPGASNCDWKSEDFLSQMESAFPKGTPIALYCRSGRRSVIAVAAAA